MASVLPKICLLATMFLLQPVGSGRPILSRPYAGVDANRYVYSNKGDFINIFLKAGVFLQRNNE